MGARNGRGAPPNGNRGPGKGLRPRVSRRGRRLRWTVGILVAATVIGTAAAVAIYRSSRPDVYRPGEEHAAITEALARDLPAGAPAPRLDDVTAAAGLDAFRGFAGHRTSQLPEDMGSGAAWGDFDNDGDEDVVVVAQGGALGAPPAALAATVLYENLGDGTFVRVSDFPETRILGMGAAWGDHDGDGWLDLVVTGYNALLLFRNEGGRLAPDPGIPDRPGYWAGASWGDFDNDRDLDLYVCGYVEYVESDADRARVSQQYGKGVPYTLNPSSYRPAANLLFRNDGDGSFTEVAEALGVENAEGRSLGALWHDLDDDGRLDLYIANDISDNVLYHNVGGAFEEISHAAWVADYRGAMGLAAGDWNRDGDDDLFVSHWIAQENALYDSLLANQPPRPPDEESSTEPKAASPDSPVKFVDVADQRGLGQIALRQIGWGAEFTDLDGDGWLDLIVSNGSTFETEDEPPRLEPMRAFLFWNGKGEHFHDLAPLNETLEKPRVGRGLAVADYDDDGDEDVLLVTHDDGVRLLRNEMQSGNWIKIRLRSLTADGSPVGFGDGTRLIATVGDAELRRTVSSTSYLSQSSRTVHLGLGDAGRVDRLEVRWLAGEASVFENLAAGTTCVITEGDPQPVCEASRRASGSVPASADERARIIEFWKHQRAAMNAIKVDGDREAAIEHFRKALALNPVHEDSLYYLSNCLVSQGDFAEATELLEELIRVSPSSHRAYKSLGIVGASAARSRAELDEAAEMLEKALAVNPEETGALLALGEIALMLGDPDTAEARLELANRTNPQAVGGYFLRGYVAWKEGDDGRARELLGRAREALGPEWTPEGMTSEGDVRSAMHVDATPLSRFWEAWDGETEPEAAFVELDLELRRRASS